VQRGHAGDLAADQRMVTGRTSVARTGAGCGMAAPHPRTKMGVEVERPLFRQNELLAVEVREAWYTHHPDQYPSPSGSCAQEQSVRAGDLRCHAGGRLADVDHRHQEK
jgi:hypothetical protein